jgi:predicted metal-dependent HD superfamily phosphohydrolase
MKVPESLSTLMPLVKELVFDTLPPTLYYHCLEHTMQVVAYSIQLAAKAGLDKKEEELLFAAAVLHDSGYGKKYRANEGVGAIFASKILPDYGFSKREIEQVKQMILATNLVVSPNNQLEMLLIDADMAYLGRDDFFMWSDRLFREWKAFGLFDGTAEAWLHTQIEFLQSHVYATPEAFELFDAGKQNNILLLKSIKKWPF